MQKYQYFEWGSILNLDGFEINTFQYIICEPFRSCKEGLAKLDVNLWEIWRKFKCHRSMSYPSKFSYSTIFVGILWAPLFLEHMVYWTLADWCNKYMSFSQQVGVLLKAFLPQLQTTFLRALSDPNRNVRLEAAQALAKLVVIHSRVDPLFTELHNGVKNTDSDISIR